MTPHDSAILAAIAGLREAGFALHWLLPKKKRPVDAGWSDAPVQSLADLRTSHQSGYNLGVRPGEPSAVAGGYLHIFDLDIRDPDQADDAWDTLETLFPDIDLDGLPMVQSGSGGESRHLLFVSDKPFRSKTLAVSEGKHRSRDPETGKDRWRYDWEIELYGTGKQVVLPPSIHPETGQPYIWLTPFDLNALLLGDAPFVDATTIERIVPPDTQTYAYENREPLQFEPGQLERDLDDVPVARLDNYDDWIALGQALHHQFGASRVGYDLWVQHSQRSVKFDGKQMWSRWRGFGRNRKAPVTMGSIRQWAIDARRDRYINAFDEEDDGEETGSLTPTIDIDILLGGESADPIDAVGENAVPAPKIDPIDDIGIAAAEPNDRDWMQLLHFTDKGELKGTLHNVELIVCNDPRLVGVPQLNEFTQEIVQRLPPGYKPPRRANQAKPFRQLEGRVWQVGDTLNGDMWSDARDFAVRSILEAPGTQGGYGIKVTDRDLHAAINLSAQRSAFHPIREYLDGVTWDGKPRVETLWIDYVGAPDDAYHREVARLMLVAAVTRIYEPGHKFDFATILEGLQGKRKSTLISTLGGPWFVELDGDFSDGKQMIELMQGAWIMEIPELTGFNRAEVQAIKAFISRQTDKARLAYAKRATSFPRQVVFIGSTNDDAYLKDSTGARRFWPVTCRVTEIDINALERNVDQIWAEAVARYRAMRAVQTIGTLPLYLADESARVVAARLQESRRVETSEDGVAGKIHAWLEKPVNDGGFEEVDADGDRAVRNYTCLLQIFVEALHGDARMYNNAKAYELGRAMVKVPGWEKVDGDEPGSDGQGRMHFGAYGRQRAYRRLT